MASLVETIQLALASVGQSLPDAVRTMCHGRETGDAIKSSSVEMSGEAATESGAVEKSRVIVCAANFPTLGSDSLVEIGGVQYLTTSMRTDPVGASATVGISSPLSNVPATWTGTRKARRISVPLDILAENNGRTADVLDGFSTSSTDSWTIVISADDWIDTDGPQEGDESRFDNRGALVTVRASRVLKKDGYYLVNARSR